VFILFVGCVNNNFAAFFFLYMDEKINVFISSFSENYKVNNTEFHKLI